ncbi:hypothetical protein [Nocardioides sp. AX2bis]|uniref:hypothetical protein n=1 Tax=Nocardioides sp. AX2bis TaxID=2653157 RepID=UPI0012F3C03C|nr:hypothetical protein [Nocardioides sp. AX2bis]VXB33660.1 hypothetical protein NOCARDAX2BIS_210074 [Nocardioides sp. AX2bis]
MTEPHPGQMPNHDVVALMRIWENRPAPQPTPQPTVEPHWDGDQASCVCVGRHDEHCPEAYADQGGDAA